MSVWVDDVDEMHKQCVAAGLEITFPPTDMHGTSVRCTFAIWMATFSGSAGDSSPKSRNPRLVLESAAVLSPKLEDASAFELRQGVEIVGIHDQPHILHRQSQDLVLRGRRTGERDQLEHRSASSIRPKALR